MTGAEFSEVDVDLLADYVGGALDGTPDEAVVTALIAENAAWRDAHDQLSAGVTAVTGQLRALGSVAEPMPADVFARLDTALLTAAAEHVPAHDSRPAAGPATAAEDAPPIGPVVMEPGSDGAAPDRHPVAVRSQSRSRRARHLRWAAPVGIAAGVLAFAGLAAQQFPGGASEDTASTAAGSAAESAAEPLAAAGQVLELPTGAVPVTETGTAYSRDSLGRADGALSAPDLPQAPGQNSRKAAPMISDGDDPFGSLRVQEALRACIDAIAAQHGREITPQTIDFARFAGAPAVIVEFTAADGSWVWASGPACGTPGVGADTRASVKVG